MQINKLLADFGDGIYYDEKFRVVLESHLTQLRNSTNTTVLNVNKGISYVYEGDFSGLLKYYKVPIQYHWLIMKLNNYKSNYEYKPEDLTILIPEREELERIRRQYMTQNKISA